MSETEPAPGFELTAAVALWRGEEILVMKRAAGFATGGWFLPGGHLEPGERPADAAVRELREETGINLEPARLALADVMTFEADHGTAHILIYNAACPDGAEAVLNPEHAVARWMTVESYCGRFLDEVVLRERGASEHSVTLAAEAARAIRTAARARGMQLVAEPPVPAVDTWMPAGTELA